MDVRDDDESIGEVVATERKLAGLTQAQLAQRAHVSVSLVRAVEQGRVPASPAFVAAVARALDVAVPDLLGQPSNPPRPDSRRMHAVIPPLRRELASYLLPPDEGVSARPLSELRSAVREMSARRQSVNLIQLGSELPGLIAELRSAASNDGSQDAYSLLALAYAAAGQIVYKLGYADLSLLATDRVEWAATRSGDELAGAAADFYRAGELIVMGEWDATKRYLEAARSRIDHRLADEAGMAMYGQLHLKSGLAAARAGDADATDAHIAEAQNLAARIGEFRNDYDLSFNRHSANIWSVGLAVELTDGAKAVERASQMQIPRGLSIERVSHHFIDLARGYLLHGDRGKSFETLLIARRLAPIQTKYHPHVRETARVLAKAERRKNDTLSNFMKWLDQPA